MSFFFEIIWSTAKPSACYGRMGSKMLAECVIQGACTWPSRVCLGPQSTGVRCAKQNVEEQEKKKRKIRRGEQGKNRGAGLISVVFNKHLFNKIVWQHVAYNNFTIHGNKCGIACSTDSIVCTDCCRKVFQTLYGVFMLSSYCKKTYRMEFLCIPGYICILCFLHLPKVNEKQEAKIANKYWRILNMAWE